MRRVEMCAFTRHASAVPTGTIELELDACEKACPSMPPSAGDAGEFYLQALNETSYA